MKNLILLLLVAVFIGACDAQAAVLNCSVPSPAIPRAQELCEEMRLFLHIRASNWSTDACATQMLTLGLLQAHRAAVRREANVGLNAEINQAINAFEPLFPEPVPAVCGDGTLDAEFGEACDDGNEDSGDGCSSSCAVE